MARLLLCAMLLGLLAGCSIQRTLFQETVDGVTTTYKSTLLIPPGGKLDKSAGAMTYKFGENVLSVGQDTSGVDNTAQADLVKAGAEAFEKGLARGAVGIVAP